MVDNNSNKVDFNKNDIVLDKFLSIYDNKTGSPYDAETLDSIYDEGEERYKNEQPPGYEDLSEKQGNYRMYRDTKIKSEYGDFIIWKQIIDKAKNDSSSVIFITDDRKEDWWKKINGQVKGPREELINEFFHETKKDFLMYNTESFLKNAKNILNVDILTETIQEVHDYSRVRRRDSNFKRLYADDRRLLKGGNTWVDEELLLELKVENIKSSIAKLEHNMMRTQKEIHKINIKSNKLNVYDRDQNEIQLVKLQRELDKCMIERAMAQKELSILEERLLKNKTAEQNGHS